MALCDVKAGSKVEKYIACPIYSLDEYIFPSTVHHVKVHVELSRAIAFRESSMGNHFPG